MKKIDLHLHSSYSLPHEIDYNICQDTIDDVIKNKENFKTFNIEIKGKSPYHGYSTSMNSGINNWFKDRIPPYINITNKEILLNGIIDGEIDDNSNKLVSSFKNCDVGMIAFTDHNYFDINLYEQFTNICFENGISVMPGIELNCIWKDEITNKIDRCHSLFIFEPYKTKGDEIHKSLEKFSNKIIEQNILKIKNNIKIINSKNDLKCKNDACIDCKMKPYNDSESIYYCPNCNYFVNTEKPLDEWYNWTEFLKILRDCNIKKFICIPHCTINKRNDSIIEESSDNQFCQGFFVDLFEIKEADINFNKVSLENKIQFSDCHNWLDYKSDRLFYFNSTENSFEALSIAQSAYNNKMFTKEKYDTTTRNGLEIVCIGDNEINFKPGLNCIIGENGSGKSIIMKTLMKLINDDSDFFKNKSKLSYELPSKAYNTFNASSPYFIRYIKEYAQAVKYDLKNEEEIKKFREQINKNNYILIDQNSIIEDFNKDYSFKEQKENIKHLFKKYFFDNEDKIFMSISKRVEDWNEKLTNLNNIIEKINKSKELFHSFFSCISLSNKTYNDITLFYTNSIDFDKELMVENVENNILALSTAHSNLSDVRETIQFKKLYSNISLENEIDEIRTKIDDLLTKMKTLRLKNSNIIEMFNHIDNSLKNDINNKNKTSAEKMKIDDYESHKKNFVDNFSKSIEHNKLYLSNLNLLKTSLNDLITDMEQSSKCEISYMNITFIIKYDNSEIINALNRMLIDLNENKKINTLDETSNDIKIFIQYRINDMKLGSSPGENAKKYFYFLADKHNCRNKILFIDQPEDHISHLFSHELISLVNEIGKNNQVIFITHSPQLVINGHFENVILVKKREKEISIKNGSFEDKINYNGIDTIFLNEIADNLDGGKSIVRKRMGMYLSYKGE